MDNDQADKELASLGVPIPKPERAYPQHVLDGFSQGALLDLRVRFAMQLMSGPGFGVFVDEAKGLERPRDREAVSFAPAGLATIALDAATALLAVADTRGLVQSIDDTAALPESLGVQAGRMGAFEAYKQIGAQAAMRAAQGSVSVVPAAPGFVPRGH